MVRQRLGLDPRACAPDTNEMRTNDLLKMMTALLYQSSQPHDVIGVDVGVDDEVRLGLDPRACSPETYETLDAHEAKNYWMPMNHQIIGWP